jgi:hypothetical protein
MRTEGLVNLKIFKDQAGNRTRDFSSFGAQPHPTAAPVAPRVTTVPVMCYERVFVLALVTQHAYYVFSVVSYCYLRPVRFYHIFHVIF